MTLEYIGLTGIWKQIWPLNHPLIYYLISWVVVSWPEQCNGDNSCSADDQRCQSQDPPLVDTTADVILECCNHGKQREVISTTETDHEHYKVLSVVPGSCLICMDLLLTSFGSTRIGTDNIKCFIENIGITNTLIQCGLVAPCAFRQQAITWANDDLNLCI